MKFLFLLLLSLATIAGTHAQNGTEPVRLTDMLQIKTAANISLKKDGTAAVFTVTSIVPDEKSKLDYKYETQLFRVSADGNTAPMQVTYAKEGASQAVWSPAGKQLAFVRTVDEKPQIFLLSMDGGEPLQLTKFKSGANNPKWSPDGKQLLFSSSVPFQTLLKDSAVDESMSLPAWPYEKPGFTGNENLKIDSSRGDPDGNITEIRNYLQNNEADKKAIVLNKLNFQNEMGISSEMNFNQFYKVNVVAGATPVAVIRGFNKYSNVDFTPDGKHLIISGDVDSLENPDRSLENEIFIADADGSNIKLLLGAKGKSYTNATASSSGKWMAFVYGPTSFVSVPTLALIPLNGTEKDMVNIEFDRSINSMKWSSDDRYLYFSGPSKGGAPLYRLNISTKKVEQLSDANSGILSFDIVGNKMLFTKTEVANPCELYMADADFKNVKKLSNLNDWVIKKNLSFPEKKTFVNDNGMTVEYWVMKPTAFAAGKKYPLLLNIHGGPSAMWGPGELSMWHEFQYFAAKGYGIVYANPRGSGGYGLDFLKGNINDWGAGPTSDVLTALDKAVALGWADSSKLLVTGGSYAGYLVAWIISHDKRFAAACSQRGVYDLSTFFGEGNAWRLVPNYFGDYPWETKTKGILVRESPITYVSNITTPYIIFHGGNDRRTGFVQGEMMYRSLKVLGRPVEYVVHPGATHEITRAGDNRQRLDQMLRTYEFFQRYIGKK
ncbi:MAG: S9 family peptidase [Chitinophagaceae bacterium]|nr:S9 family peptidase [Chitinophagaceae bacterium]